MNYFVDLFYFVFSDFYNFRSLTAHDYEYLALFFGTFFAIFFFYFVIKMFFRLLG